GRRRHTRFSRDWSSDVCSSDLPKLVQSRVELAIPVARLVVDDAAARRQEGPDFASEPSPDDAAGTRTNMLSGALLDAAQFPTIKDRKSTRLNSSHVKISYAVFC